jgi:hypothetical protein
MTDTLREIINEAMQANQNPETQDTPAASDTEDTAAEAVTEELPEDAEVEVGEDEILATDDEEETTEEAEETESKEAGETFEVKVDGETVKITLDEALAGYQRQADYTRKAQALAAEREEIEQAKSEFSEVVQQVSALDTAWNENPISVIAHFTASTENPTQAVALLIKELASANLLEREFLDVFGITPEVRGQWSQEAEINQLRSKAARSDTEAKTRAEAAEMEAAVQRAIVQFDRDLDEIISSEGLNLNTSQRAEFRKQLAGYARDNEITNLRAAYKALRYEEDSQKRKVAQKTAERTKQKKATSAVARKGSGDAGSAPVSSGPADLRSLIADTMKELGG